MQCLMGERGLAQADLELGTQVWVVESHDSPLSRCSRIAISYAASSSARVPKVGLLSSVQLRAQVGHLHRPRDRPDGRLPGARWHGTGMSRAMERGGEERGLRAVRTSETWLIAFSW